MVIILITKIKNKGCDPYYWGTYKRGSPWPILYGKIREMRIMLLWDFSTPINPLTRNKEHSKILYIHYSRSTPTVTPNMRWEHLGLQWKIKKHWYIFFPLKHLRISRCCLSRLWYFPSRTSSRQNIKWDRICIFLSSVLVTYSMLYLVLSNHSGKVIW